MTGFLKRHWPALGYALLIFFLSSLPSLRSPDLGFSAEDKLLHGLEYFVFGLLLFRSTRLSGRRPASAAALALALAVAFAASDETHQRFVPGRLADTGDFLADAAGAAVGVLFRMAAERGRCIRPGGR